MSQPTVTVAVPALNEERHIDACLEAIAAQTYPGIVEVLVLDGGSSDATVALAHRHPLVRVVPNTARIQAAAMNLALAEAAGDVVVRVDGHTVLAPDYVERCVSALEATGAAMVGGGMHPTQDGGWVRRGIAAAMRSPVGAGPARFHGGGPAGWVDTVYMGAYRVEVARAAGGYAVQSVNEDAEFAHRMSERGGVWFDPSIRSAYTARGDLMALGRQYYRYGRGRAATVRRHPGSVAPRQLAAPLLVLGLLSPWRRRVLRVYGAVVAAGALREARRDAAAAAGFVVALPVMHLAWGVGFLVSLARQLSRS